MQPFLFHSMNPGRPLMQPVLLTAGAPAAFATTVRPPLAAVVMKPEPQSQLLPPPPPPVPQPPPVELYLCGTTQTATEPPAVEGEREKDRASLDFVEKTYQELNSKKIKDSLSAFLDDIPGEFDSVESETMLRHLIDHRPIGGKEFHPLTGQALLGFRLLPGALPEQYRMDPPSREPKPHHRKRKHKHKSLDRTEDSADSGPPPPTQAKLPSDAYNFIRQDPPSSGLHVAPPVVQSKVITGPGHMPYQPLMGAIPNVVATPPMMADPTRGNIFDTQKRKKKKRDKDKERKKDKKEKKKKREKHHSQDPPGAMTVPPPLVSHPPAPPSYTQFPPT